MANNPYSPYETPGQEYFFDEKRLPSPPPTPSPRASAFYFGAAQQRPAVRAHFRNPSVNAGFNYSSPRGPSFSPRYTSDGQYATVSFNYSSRRGPSSSPQYNSDGQYATANTKPLRPNHSPSPSNRRSGQRRTDGRSNTSEDSDEDEYIEINGVFYVLTARRSKPSREYYTVNAGATDYHYHAQGVRLSPPQTRKSPEKPSTKRQATEAEAKLRGNPVRYSLKNWDPSEEPIPLLGSVFDADSLGKWIYDWTVYHHGPSTLISDMAGELWLLLLPLAGKLKRADSSKDIESKGSSVDLRADDPTHWRGIKAGTYIYGFLGAVSGFSSVTISARGAAQEASQLIHESLMIMAATFALPFILFLGKWHPGNDRALFYGLQVIMTLVMGFSAKGWLTSTELMFDWMGYVPIFALLSAVLVSLGIRGYRDEKYYSTCPPTSPDEESTISD
ncbi:hypothetical protein B0H63DRAFT_547096 [Podospora didyma]|uniref:Uncharacterized protein n=1 Tax=Podospora didyma TaxID=330526 RepID=A0AAE0KJV6_9PEZI|nr:hypothetical protein B0H63DRAFT_547096 [Podospora didyma]